MSQRSLYSSPDWPDGSLIIDSNEPPLTVNGNPVDSSKINPISIPPAVKNKSTILVTRSSGGNIRESVKNVNPQHSSRSESKISNIQEIKTSETKLPIAPGLNRDNSLISPAPVIPQIKEKLKNQATTSIERSIKYTRNDPEVNFRQSLNVSNYDYQNYVKRGTGEFHPLDTPTPIPLSTPLEPILVNRPFETTTVPENYIPPFFPVMTNGQELKKTNDSNLPNFRNNLMDNDFIFTSNKTNNPSNSLNIQNEMSEEMKKKKIQRSKNIQAVLIVIFIGMEVFGKRYMGIDTTGFTESQWIVMNNYEEVVSELMDGYTTGVMDGWHPMVKLTVYVVIYYIGFIIIKLVTSLLPANVSDDIRKGIWQLLRGAKLGDSESGPNEPDFLASAMVKITELVNNSPVGSLLKMFVPGINPNSNNQESNNKESTNKQTFDD